MKILIASVTYYPDVNGASYFTHRLAYYLKKAGHEILIIAPSRSMRNEMSQHNGIDAFGVRSYPIFLYPDFRWAPPFFTEKNLEKVIRQFQPDVIHMQSHFLFCANVVKIAKKLKIPVMGTNHFMPENLVHYVPMPEFLKRQVMKFGWQMFRRVYDKMDYLTAPTKTAALLSKRSGIKMDITPVSNGIDMEKFNARVSGEGLREKYHLPDKPLLLTVGRLDKEKNVDMIMRAVKLVPKEINFHFAIAGKGAEKDNLIKLAQNLGITDRVSFLGFVPDEELPGLYAISSCFINACIAELQCIAAMEAMATGLPVIAADAVALPELVHDGDNGFLFKVGDTEKIAHSITKIFSDEVLRQKMAEQSLEIIKKHDIKNVINQFESIYTQIIQEHAARK
jgi:glycosyltransferase involved in cell wall biosynthesis